MLQRGVMCYLLEQTLQLAAAVCGQIGTPLDAVGRIRQNYGNAVLERKLVDDRTDGRNSSNLHSLHTECVAPKV